MVRLVNGAIDAAGAFIALCKLPELYSFFLAEAKDTTAVEAQGAEILEAGCSPAEAVEFVRAVCVWGGRTGTWHVLPRIMRDNTPDRLARQLAAACCHLVHGPQGRVGAMREVQQISGLGKSGAVSYASKHLRMLAPQICVTLDSKLSEKLIIPATRSGFDQLSRECQDIAYQLNTTPSPARPTGGLWQAADIEACIFTHLFPNSVSGWGKAGACPRGCVPG